MPSPALITWSTDSAAALAELEQIAAVGGNRDARQVCHAYVLILCAHFQAYCRALHSDATQVLVDSINPAIGAVLDANLSFGRRLDRGNAQPQTLSTDFRRLGIEFWPAVESSDSVNAARRRRLEELNAWRNAIAHHDVEGRRGSLVPHEITLAACLSWRRTTCGLAEAFDTVVTDHLKAHLDLQPW